ncbi:swr1-complex 5 protein [Rutstroemia sp. NJR-2017a BBW]|nr:swr1-complex 5 protein [Rutstroemia sp. NJR-2017a BBW]
MSLLCDYQTQKLSKREPLNPPKMSTLLGKRKRVSAAAIPSKQSKVLKIKETKASKSKPIPQPELENEDEDQDEETSQSEADSDSDSDSEQTLDPQEIFRRHFEAQFKPLPVVAQKLNPDLESEDQDEDEDDWDGLSETSAADEHTEERNNGVQVVEHVNIDARTVGMSRAELRAFMSSKPPSSHSLPLSTTPSSRSDPETPQSEALNLKNDLELQRLLSESHLLTSTPGNSALPSLHGSNRIKALDLRIQALGAKSREDADEDAEGDCEGRGREGGEEEEGGEGEWDCVGEGTEGGWEGEEWRGEEGEGSGCAGGGEVGWRGDVEVE